MYLGVTAVYAALVAFVTDKATPNNLLTFILFALSFISLAAGIVFAIVASTVTSYEVPFGAEDIATEAEQTPGMSEADFIVLRLADYAVAYKQNVRVNENKARLLWVAATALWLGIVLNGCYMTDFVWERYVWPKFQAPRVHPLPTPGCPMTSPRKAIVPVK